MMAIKLLAATVATLLALPAAAQNPASAEKRAQAPAQSAQHTPKERRKAAQPCAAPRSGKSASAK